MLLEQKKRQWNKSIFSHWGFVCCHEDTTSIFHCTNQKIIQSLWTFTQKMVWKQFYLRWTIKIIRLHLILLVSFLVTYDNLNDKRVRFVIFENKWTQILWTDGPSFLSEIIFILLYIYTDIHTQKHYSYTLPLLTNKNTVLYFSFNSGYKLPKDNETFQLNAGNSMRMNSANHLPRVFTCLFVHSPTLN